MSAARIFAALDAAGKIRFIGDVPGGAACKCFCSVCGSPLQARQGEINIWHFSHEARQERPQCVPGAVNLLRRMAAEHLRSLPRLVLPRYQRTVRRNSVVGNLTEEVGWDAQVWSINWLVPSTRDAPVAAIELDNGLSAELFIEIGERPLQSEPSNSTVGKLVFSSSLPRDSDLREEVHARRYLQRHGVLGWVHQPDVFGLIAAAGQRLDQKAAEEEQRATAARRTRDLLFGEKHSAPPPLSASAPAAPLPEWALHKKRNRPFFGYRLTDGSTWAWFELERGGYALRCVPGDEGWEEAVPITVGRFDEQLQLVVAETFQPAQRFLEDRRTHTCIGSDFGDLLKLASGT